MNVGRVGVPIVLIVLVAAVLAIPSVGSLSVASAHPGRTGEFASRGLLSLAAPPAPAATGTAPAVPHPATTYPRTVLIETFTGVWCPHCPAETQALYLNEQTTSTNVLDIAELHGCGAPPPNCGDNYVPPDGTTNTRGTYYGLQGYPTVIFDGNYQQVGATNSASQMGAIYNSSIANASAYAGNVSIAQNSSYVYGNVSDSVNIMSGITGTYNVVSYLLESIDKTGVNNGGGPHDIGRVVRETLRNAPANFTAGASTHLDLRGSTLSTWNPANFSVVTFVQENSTHIVENANLSPVHTLVATVTASPNPVITGNNTTITVSVLGADRNGSHPLAGTSVALQVTGGGHLATSSGVTGATGTFVDNLTSPIVTSPTNLVVTATLTAPGYLSNIANGFIRVNPPVLSPIPSSLTVTPGAGVVTLNWTVPQTGGNGVTYFLYRGTDATGTGYAFLGTSTSTWYNDTTVAAGQSYWYTVNAYNTTAFSKNSTVSGASAVTASPSGLPSSVGWKVGIDGANFTSLSSHSLALFLPEGTFGYQFYSESYAYQTAVTPNQVTTSGTPQTITAAFVPRWATLDGTLQPGSATVTIGGTSVPVSNGAFSAQLAAGTYVVNVTASGFIGNSTNVTVTPGNTTQLTVALDPLPASGSSPLLSGSTATIAIFVVAAVVGILAVMAYVLRSGSRGRSPPRGRTGGPRAPPGDL